MKNFRYITIYTDLMMSMGVCELVHFASSLPDAIKEGRSYVRDLNHEHKKHHPGYKRYIYNYTYRSR